jgi:hypothetical protein
MSDGVLVPLLSGISLVLAEFFNHKGDKSTYLNTSLIINEGK